MRVFPTLHVRAWTRVTMADAPRAGLNVRDPAAQSTLAPDYSYGGFMEDRTDLWRGFEPDMKQMIHLGVDLSAPAGTPVACPARAVVCNVMRDATPFNGWGGRVIVCLFEGAFPYVLLGHLHPNSITVNTGEVVDAGHVIGVLGGGDSNGGWFPHLHVQQMSKVWDGCDGYAEADAPALQWVCDPMPLIQ
jgi:hypothetical protein